MSHRILFVEDDPQLREVAADYLRAVGYEVVLAESGRDGVLAARTRIPDLIVSDVMMPDGNGFDLLRELRSNRETSLIPFIFITAKGDRSDIRLGMSLGADDYITKPFSFEELETSIRSRLEKKDRMNEALATMESRSMVSLPHELRTPLNGILGVSELMRETLREGGLVPPAELQENLDILLDCSTRLQRLVENYLLFYELRLATANPEQSRALRRTTCHFPSDLHLLQSRVASAQREADVSIELESANLRLAEELAQKAVYELLDNALKFSSPGDAIRVRGRREGTRYRVEVSDGGIGLSGEQIARIGPFVQFARESREQQGIGLGLFLIRMIMELCRGSLDVESAGPRSGSRFVLTIPLVTKED